MLFPIIKNNRLGNKINFKNKLLSHILRKIFNHGRLHAYFLQIKIIFRHVLRNFGKEVRFETFIPGLL